MFQSLTKIVLTENEKINKKHHITEKDRIKIEALMVTKQSAAEISEQIGCSERTVKREIKRGTVRLITSELIQYETYKADYAQIQHEKTAKNKGRYPKLNNNAKLRKYVENKIKNEKYSPEAALFSAKNDGLKVDISVKTLYNGSGALLTLTDRKSREEIIVKLPNKEQKSVESAFEKMKNKNFKTITWDNGSEFLNFKNLQEASGAVCYYAHPYSSWERGSNENANGIIRRFFPKGTDFSKVSARKIKQVQDWMNNYPRKILGGLSVNLFLAKPVI